MTLEQLKSAAENEFHSIVEDNLEHYFDYFYCQTDVDDYYLRYDGQKKYDIEDIEIEDGESTWLVYVCFDAYLDGDCDVIYGDAGYTAERYDEYGKKVETIKF